MWFSCSWVFALWSVLHWSPDYGWNITTKWRIWRQHLYFIHTVAGFGLLELKCIFFWHRTLYFNDVLCSGEVVRSLILPQKSHDLKWLNLTFYPLDLLVLLLWVVLIPLWSFCCFILNTDLENYAAFLLSLWCLQPSRLVFSYIRFFFLIPSLRFFPESDSVHTRGFLSTLISSGVEIEGLCYLTAGVPAPKSPADYNVSNPQMLASPLTLTGSRMKDKMTCADIRPSCHMCGISIQNILTIINI